MLVRAGERVLVSDAIAISPEQPYSRRLPLPQGLMESDVRLSLVDAAGRELIAYQPRAQVDSPMPEVVIPPAAPKDIATNEETLLAGQRLEQFQQPGGRRRALLPGGAAARSWRLACQSRPRHPLPSPGSIRRGL